MKHKLTILVLCICQQAVGADNEKKNADELAVWEVTDVKGAQTQYSTRTDFKNVNKKLELLPAPKTE
jgi:hypothetical protein